MFNDKITVALREVPCH